MFYSKAIYDLTTTIQGEEIHQKGKWCGFTACRFKPGPITVICFSDKHYQSRP